MVGEAQDELASTVRKGTALNKAKQYLDAEQNAIHKVPEQYKRETPFTVSKSTTPPKVADKFKVESLNKKPLDISIGGKTKQVPTVRAAKLPDDAPSLKKVIDNLEAEKVKVKRQGQAH